MVDRGDVRIYSDYFKTRIVGEWNRQLRPVAATQVQQLQSFVFGGVIANNITHKVQALCVSPDVFYFGRQFANRLLCESSLV